MEGPPLLLPAGIPPFVIQPLPQHHPTPFKASFPPSLLAGAPLPTHPPWGLWASAGVGVGIQRRLQDSNWVRSPAHEAAAGSLPNTPTQTGAMTPASNWRTAGGQWSSELGGWSPRAGPSVSSPKQSTAHRGGTSPKSRLLLSGAPPPAGLSVLSSHPCRGNPAPTAPLAPTCLLLPACTLSHLPWAPGASAPPPRRVCWACPEPQTHNSADAELGRPRPGLDSKVEAPRERL